MWPLATDGAEKASSLPKSVIFHLSLGPAAGHSLSKPVSEVVPSRLGPRSCGQSAAQAEVHDNTAQTVSKANCLRGMAGTTPHWGTNWQILDKVKSLSAFSIAHRETLSFLHIGIGNIV